MKKKFIFMLFAALLLIPLCALLLPPKEAPVKVALSRMSDQQILGFLASYEIEIPEQVKSIENYMHAIHGWIAKAEENPKVKFNYATRSLYDLSNAIKDAVNDYYGVSPRIIRNAARNLIFFKFWPYLTS